MSAVSGARHAPSPRPADERWVAGTPPPSGAPAFPHVIAWNVTRRCNLACAHCYISAGSWHAAGSELSTRACLRIVDEILEVNGAPMLILSGGEPLVRDDLETIARRASEGGATVVVGTNGTGLHETRIDSLADAGVRGFAVSIDSLDPTYHDRFRHGEGALADTIAAVDRLRSRRLDFLVQTTVTRGNRGQLVGLAAWAADRGAMAFNVYFLVATGRGESMRGLAPAENEEVLAEIERLGRVYRGRMLVRSKCNPAIMRHVLERDPASSLADYATRCPCGVHYCRITPEGKVTPCPYHPVEAGDLAKATFGEVWERSETFAALRSGRPGGKCGRCEYRVVCGGCRARAWAEEGDLLAADPACGYEPDDEAPVIEPRSVTYGSPEVERELVWSPEAEARIARAPSFVRGVVTARVEKFAAEHGYDSVTTEVLDEVRSSLPVDFSKKRPFFLNRRGGSS